MTVTGGNLRAVLGAFGVAVVMAGPVAAMMPEPGCAGDGAGSAAFGAYQPWPVGTTDDFVTYETVELATDRSVSVLEYCPERRQLVLRAGGDEPTDAAARAMLDEMVHGPAPFTMTEMAERLRGIGADAEIRTVDYESCACAYW